jgi:uncharacterized protein
LTPFFHRKSATEIIAHVRVTPKSAKDMVDGVEVRDDGKAYLRICVRAVPEDGKANKAVEKLVAKFLDVAAGSVTVLSGGTSRMKMLSLKGDVQAMEDRFASLCTQRTE